MTEKAIETKLREEVKKSGGLALKFSSSYYTGIPDRIILLPGGKIIFVELKAPGKKPTPIQEVAIRKLRGMDFWVEVVDSCQTLEQLITEINQL
jgi:hypothetical protein